MLKDVCYLTTDKKEPYTLKGQIIAIKDPDSVWSAAERGSTSDSIFNVITIDLPEDFSLEHKYTIVEENGNYNLIRTNI
jgi:hypothetical protein